MQIRLFFILGLLATGLTVKAQTPNEDAIFEKLKQKYSVEAYENARRDYEVANDTVKAIMLNVYSMPMSSRKETIENYEAHIQEINNLKNEFSKIVPKGYVVSLNIELADNPLRSIVSIDLMISKKNKEGKLELVDGEFDLEYGSERLDQLLRILKWDPMTFSNIRFMMQLANCCSIENGNPVEIGFTRSGLGKYSYLIFPTDILTVPQIKQYNDGCEYMYYKKNVVIKYEGGMAGPQCFTD
ncbi:hypothetical protein [Dysgonomonas macrotermitis]|uniref:DUF3298 domain-containing protein n=1 Tax=Dysgonomonas macrotermitis TaxID=1346286 RepID=A0A1M4Y8V9_9BACT|nr:hypothetical protein [Dysgonomonas macrotermitis]SHF02191.1 hypothetical protein SAMN05444362_103106 [Dysgonomonas macrotermitis]